MPQTLETSNVRNLIPGYTQVTERFISGKVIPYTTVLIIFFIFS